MRTQLVTIATDTTPLDGAFHEPDDSPVKGGVLLFHGNTMNFYTGAPRFLPPVLTALGYACLAFNRRGHDILAIRDSRAAEGGAFQTTAEAVEDNRLAARWMAARGYPTPIVIGHSNGGMLAVQHAHDHRETPALILLSAIGGKTSLASAKAATWFLAGADSEAVFDTAQRMIAEGRGDALLLLPGWWYAISARSFVDRMTTVPSIVALAPAIRAPALYIRGDRESAAVYPAEAYAAASGGPCEVRILPGCDHFYKGCEDAVSECVAGWLKKTLN
jgi:pimeloyl-ACP methyl ester carboxylesterase